MQHLDEGTLQAWLDRPRSGLDSSEVADIERHLEVCGDCASRLSALQESSDRVRSLLALDGGDAASAPPYDQITARALGTRRRQRAQRRRTVMAWAASIVVAIGVGWMTNDLYRSGVGVEAPRYESVPVQAREPVADAGRPARSGATEAPAEEAERAPAAARPAVPLEDRDAARRDARPAAPLENRAAPRRDARPAAPVAPPSLARAAEPNAEPSPVVAQTEPATEPERSAGAGARPSEAAKTVVVSGRVVDEQGDPVSAAQVFVSDRDVGVLTQQDGRYSLTLPEPDDSDSTSFDVMVERIGFGRETRLLAGRPGDTVVADFNLKEEALQLDEVIVTGAAGDTQRRALGNSVQSLSASQWRSATDASAAETLGRPLRTVPGLDVLTIDVDDDGAPDGTPLVRVRQQIGDGLTLTLVEGRNNPDLERWSLTADGPIESIRLGDLLITGTAPVSPDSLRAMLETLR